MFFSQQTKNQIVSFLSSIIVIFFLLVLANDFSASVFPRFIQDNLVGLTPIYHFQNFIKGIVDFKSLIYFLSFIAVFLFLTIVDLEKRN
jgi:ABC-2 type transport system permease protein